MEFSKALRKINKDDLLVSYDFNSLYSSTEIDKNSTWPAIQTTHPFKVFMNDAVCELLNSGRWIQLTRSAFSTVKNQNPENLIFQHTPRKEKVKTSLIKRID